MTPIVAIDCETTGVHPDRRPWEIAMIRRDDTGQTETTLFVIADLSNADPFGLKVGRFYDRHPFYGPASSTDAMVHTEQSAATIVEEITRGAHLVGLVPSFDAETLDKMLRRHRLIPSWHYHVIDVEPMAIGYLHGLQVGNTINRDLLAPPTNSDELSRACSIEPPTDEERHTALGDARWAMRWYDHITAGRAEDADG